MGYPQQPPYGQPPPPYGQQPYGPPGGEYPPAPSSGPAVAILAAVFGLVATAAFVVLPVDTLSHLGGASFTDMKGDAQIITGAQIGCALVLLIGAILVFTRKVAGAIMLAIGGVGGVFTAGLLTPLIIDAAGIGDYLEFIFEFDGAQGSFAAIGLIASALTLLFSLLPPTFSYLRGSKAADFQNQGW